RIAGRLRIARELDVFFRDMRRRSTNLDVRAIRLVDPRQWIVALAVTPPHALVLTVSHGFFVRQPLLCDGSPTPISSLNNLLRIPRRSDAGMTCKRPRNQSRILASPISGRTGSEALVHQTADRGLAMAKIFPANVPRCEFPSAAWSCVCLPGMPCSA